MFDLNEGFFSGDDDCWIDEKGEVIKLDRANRQTHRHIATKLFPNLPADHDANKTALEKGWVRLWVERTICFVEISYTKVSRQAIATVVRILPRLTTIQKVWIEDGFSMAYEEIDDVRKACSKLRQISIKADMSLMFEDDLVEKYTTPNTMLKNYMANASFDHYQVWWLFDNWAKKSDYRDEIEDTLGECEDYGEMDPEVFEKLDPEIQKDFQEWSDQYMMQHEPVRAGTHQFFDNQVKMLPRNTWLVHFTHHADDIYQQGFTHGTYDPYELGLTTHNSHESKKGGGYNFAFVADSRYAENAGRLGKYGPDFVMFQSAGVEAFHYGDDETQIIFWGPDVDRRHIAHATRNDDGTYSVLSKTGIVLRTGPYQTVVEWIKNHHRQYSNVLFDH